MRNVCRFVLAGESEITPDWLTVVSSGRTALTIRRRDAGLGGFVDTRTPVVVFSMRTGLGVGETRGITGLDGLAGVTFWLNDLFADGVPSSVLL